MIQKIHQVGVTQTHRMKILPILKKINITHCQAEEHEEIEEPQVKCEEQHHERNKPIKQGLQGIDRKFWSSDRVEIQKSRDEGLF